MAGTELEKVILGATGTGPYSVPGIVCLSSNGYSLAHGTDAAGEPLTQHTLFPLTCLTKLAVAAKVLEAAADGALDVDAAVALHLPETGETGITARHVLTHSAGLPLDLPFSYGHIGPMDVRPLSLECRPTFESGARMSYSNIGYGWLAIMLERLSGQRLQELLPTIHFGDELPARAAMIADVRTAADDDHQPINSAYWRCLALPWAGGFAPISSVMSLLDWWIAHVPIAESIPGGYPGGSYFGFNATAQLEWAIASWSLGVEMRGTKAPHWVTASPRSFGHIGNSGILVWRDDNTTIVIAGARTTDGGWLLRHAPRLTGALFQGARS